MRPLGSKAQEIYDVTDPSHPVRLTEIVGNLDHTHKNWWECDTGIAYLVANAPAEGWKGQHMKIYDLSDPAKPIYIRDFGLLGQQPGATSYEGVAGGIAIHGMISAGTAKNRVYAAYGTGANGVIQILDRKKLLTSFENPKKPTTEEMLAPQVGYLTMSPDQGAHTTFPIFGEPIPGIPGTCGAEDSGPADRAFGIVTRRPLLSGPCGRPRRAASRIPRGYQQRSHALASFDVSRA